MQWQDKSSWMSHHLEMLPTYTYMWVEYELVSKDGPLLQALGHNTITYFGSVFLRKWEIWNMLKSSSSPKVGHFK